MCSSTGLPGAGEQVGERVGVGRVAGLDLLRLRQPELGEEHLLELLGRAEVELVPDDRVGRLLGRLDLAVERGRHLREVVDVGRDADPLHLGQHVLERQLDLVQQPGRAARLEVLVQRGGQVEGGHRPPDQRDRRLLLVGAVQRELHVAAGRVAQLLAQVAQRQVGQVEGPLAGQGEVGGEGGVAAEALQRPAVRGEGVDRALGVVQRLRVALVGQPVGQRAVVVRGQLGRVDESARAVGGGERDGGGHPDATAPAARQSQSGPFDRTMIFQPGGDLSRGEDGRVDLEAPEFLIFAGGVAGGLGGRAGQAVGEGRVEPVAQHPELQGVEEVVDRVAVGPGGRQLVRRRADRLGRQVADAAG